MKKHGPTKSPRIIQSKPPIIATPGDTNASLPDNGGGLPDETLQEGDGVILMMGGGERKLSPRTQRQALVKAATAGDPDAQSRMGDHCRVGDEFTPQDFSESVRWYRLAAAQGDPNAQNNIGAMFEHGMGVPEDMAEAVAWYRLAAAQSLATAQFNFAECLLYGNGVKTDEHEAAAWLHKSAAQGHIDSLTELGTLYRWGHGVEQRIGIAAEMLTIAALEGDQSALGNLAEYHDLVEADAKDGSLLSALSLAKGYDRGLGVELSKAKMFAWLLWGEERGDRDDDADVREEHDSMRGFYGMVLGDDIKDAAWEMFNTMRAANPCLDGTKLKRLRKPSRRKKRVAPKPIADGG